MKMQCNLKFFFLLLLLFFDTFTPTDTVVNLAYETATIHVTELDGNNVKIEWNPNRETTKETRFIITVDNGVDLEYEWPAQIYQTDKDALNNVELVKIDSSFSCYSLCIKTPTCKRVIRRHPTIETSESDVDCILRTSNSTSSITVTDWEGIGISDYSDETVINDLPYGYVYKFKVGIVANNDTYESEWSTDSIDFSFKWKQITTKRTGFETVSIEWERDDRFLASRVYFEFNGNKIDYSSDNYKWETDLIKPNYYDITDWNAESILNGKSEEECKIACLNNINCLFAIYFYRDQYQPSITPYTNNRKPLKAKANTCVLRNGLKIQSAVKKDNSVNLFYLTLPITKIEKEFNITVDQQQTFKLICSTPYGSKCNSDVFNQSFPKITVGLEISSYDNKQLKLKLKNTLSSVIPVENLVGYVITVQDDKNISIKEIDSNVYKDEIEVDYYVNTVPCFNIILKDKFGKRSVKSINKCADKITFETTISKTVDTFVSTGKAELICDYKTTLNSGASFEIDPKLIESFIWMKNGAPITTGSSVNINNNRLLFNNLDSSLNDGQYSCSILLKNTKESIPSKPFEVKILTITPSIESIAQQSQSKVKVQWNVNNKELFDITRYKVLVSIGSKKFYWPAQMELIDENLDGPTIGTYLIKDSIFDCQSECIDNQECVAIQAFLTGDNKIYCLLKSDTTVNGTKQPKSENFKLKNLNEDINIDGLPYGLTINFQLSLYDEKSGVWSQNSAVASKETPIAFNYNYTQLGIKKMLFEWKQSGNYNYTLSRFSLFYNEGSSLITSLDSDSLETYEFEPYNFYEPPFDYERDILKSEQECYDKCAKSATCVQYLYYKEYQYYYLKNETYLTGLNLTKNSCFLITNINIHKGILVNQEAVSVKSVRSVNVSKYLHDAISEKYNLTLKALTPYGDAVYSKKFELIKESIRVELSQIIESSYNLTANLSWPFQTKDVNFNKHAIVNKEQSSNNELYYILKESIKNIGILNSDGSILQSFYKTCLLDPKCYYFAILPDKTFEMITSSSFDQCASDKICVAMNNFTTKSTIDRLKVNTEYSFKIEVTDFYGESITTENEQKIFIPFAVQSRSSTERPKEGQNVTFYCEYTEINEELNIEWIKWFHNDNRTEIGSNKELVILDLNHLIHNGVYGCEIKLKNNQVIPSNNFINMTIEFGPIFDFSTSRNPVDRIIKINESEPLGFTCQIEGQPRPEIQLYFEGTPLNQTLTNPDGFKSIAVYEFENIKRENNGTYSCRYSNGSTIVEESFDVFVYYPPKLESNLNGTGGVNLSIYKNEIIECSVDYYDDPSKPKPFIEWTKDGIPIKALNISSIDSSNITHFISKLLFNPPKRSDSGIYVCTVKGISRSEDLTKTFDILFRSRAQQPTLKTAEIIGNGELFVKWATNDFGGADLTEVDFEWLNSEDELLGEVTTSVSRNSNETKISGYPKKATKLQIILKTELGKSDASKPRSISCNDKSCHTTPGPQIGTIVGSSLGSAAAGIILTVAVFIAILKYRRSKIPQQENHEMEPTTKKENLQNGNIYHQPSHNKPNDYAIVSKPDELYESILF